MPIVNLSSLFNRLQNVHSWGRIVITLTCIQVYILKFFSLLLQTYATVRYHLDLDK